MAQYKIFNEGTSKIYTDGDDTFRIQVRSGVFYKDKALTGDGFSGIEDTDWENIASYKSPSGLGIFRHGVRDGGWVIDETLTATGFSGTEDIDWEMLDNFKRE